MNGRSCWWSLWYKFK